MTDKSYPVYKKYWCIEPRDTALFRDARPFGAGEAASSLPFPWPSTIAGFVRSRLGMNAANEFEWTPAQARKVAVAGPWLVELEPSTEHIKTHLFPAPRDAVFFRVEGAEGVESQLLRRRLAQRAHQADEWSDLPEGKQLVGFARDPGENPGKPARGPAMWRTDTLQAWLNDPNAHDEEPVIPDEVGVGALPRERRTHVKIDYNTQTAETGALFQTEQLRFERYDAKQGRMRRFALVAATQANVDETRLSTRTSATGSLGGERRMASVYPIQDAVPLTCPELGADEEIIRVVLLTPAIFEAGYCPGAAGLGEGVEVVAAATDRFQAVSGWSFERPQGPKPTRYMAPAGSVFWLSIPGGAAAWATARHLTCISDDPQDRLDGFGLIAIGRAQ